MRGCIIWEHLDFVYLYEKFFLSSLWHSFIKFYIDRWCYQSGSVNQGSFRVTKGFVWWCSGESEATKWQVPYHSWPTWYFLEAMYHTEFAASEISFPFILLLILSGSIRRKKSRDTLILSAVIAACTLFLIIYWLSK